MALAALPSTQQNPTVTAGGTYTVTATGLNGCTSTDTADVLIDQTNPIPAATTDTLTCSLTDVPLNGSANTSVTYAWAGPGGFNSSQQTPMTNAPGDYTLVVTAANGCTGEITVTVNQNIAAPNVSAAGNTISCNSPTVPLSGSSSTNGTTFDWSGPGSFSSTMPNPTVSLDGNYTLLVTGLNGCTSTATVAVLIDTVTAVLSAAPDAVLTCSATTINIQTDVTVNASSLQGLAWSGPNAFSSALEDPAVTTPGLYTLVATLANGCTSTLQVTVDQDIANPDVSAVGDTITCTVTSVLLDGGSITAGATYAWTGPNAFSSNLEDPTASLDGVYTLTVTAPNGCTSSTTATVDLNTTAPGATAVSQNNLDCDDLSSNLTASATAGSVTYAWTGPNSFTDNTAIVAVSNPGTYNVVITGTNGCTSTADVTVTQDILAPGATATGDTIECITGIGVLNGSSPASGVTWSWTGPGGFTSTMQNPSVPQSGTYTLTVTGLNACTSTTTAFVAQNTSAPDVTLSGSGILDCAVTSIPVTATINTPGATGVWTGPGGFTSTNMMISITVPGNYVYTVTATNGCLSSPAVNIPQNIQNPQGVTASGGLLNCTSPTISIGSGSSTAGVTYSWSGPGGYASNLQNPSVNTPGTYTVTVTDPVNSCTTTATATVTQDPTVPDLAVSTNVLTCSTTSVTLATTTTTPNVTFAWTGPNGFSSTLEDPLVTQPGNYNLVATASSGCTSSFAITVDQDINTPDVTVQGLTLSCTSPTGQIVGNSNTPGVVYSWSGPGGFTSTQTSPTVNLTGNYILTVTATNGCTNTATAAVLPDASIPQITATGGTVTCAVTSLQLNATSSIQNVTWSWTGPAGFASSLQNPTVTAPGNYTLVVTAANGCTNGTAATVLANTTGPSIIVGTPDELDCTTTQVILNGSVPTPGSYVFSWTTQNGNILSGANSQTPTVSEEGVYSLVVTNNDNGCSSTQNVTVLVDPATPSSAVLQTNDVSCFGDTNGAVLINNIVGGTPPFLYSIDSAPLSTNTLVTSLAPGTHSLLIQDANGCELQTSFVINEPEELFVNLGPDTTIELGQTIYLSLDNTVNFPDRVENLIVNPEELQTVLCDTCNHEYLPTYSFQYRLTVVDSNGCKASDIRLIIVDRTRHVYIPNIFNPESSGVNGLFLIYGGDDVVEIKSFQVFDRWGSLVHEYFSFAPNYIPSAWDGKVNGEKANPGVFVYYAEILFKDGETVLYKGDVSLIRQ
ncbi:MAG: gliding motility-associated C-terminal domain-containing protein [Lewinellaceae bacterium]|nr:gliding motility-associated C-terminal domain-containing protein [Lewinellaceae bacterium]